MAYQLLGYTGSAHDKPVICFRAYIDSSIPLFKDFSIVHNSFFLKQRGLTACKYRFLKASDTIKWVDAGDDFSFD